MRNAEYQALRRAQLQDFTLSKASAAARSRGGTASWAAEVS
jgi:hypothetical protein